MAEKLPTPEQLEAMLVELMSHRARLKNSNGPKRVLDALDYLIEVCEMANQYPDDVAADIIQWARERVSFETRYAEKLLKTNKK